MLSGRLLRVRLARNRVIPAYLAHRDPAWLETAGRLRELFRAHEGKSRGELGENLRESFGDDPAQLIHQGLAKLLEDRCEFAVVSGHSPEELRQAVFQAAAAARARPPAVLDGPAAAPSLTFNRDLVLREVASRFGLTATAVEEGLFADLKSEERLVRFKDITPERLLERYNVALAQGVILRSTEVVVLVRGEPPARLRQLLRLVKFHRLVCEVRSAGPNAFALRLDGPLSLFSATQKYGLQLGLFLPAVLRCRDFELRAELLWGPARRPKTLTITPADGLVSHARDAGTYVPPELAMFADLFRRKVADWDLRDEPAVFPLGESFWVPDFRLIHRASGT